MKVSIRIEQLSLEGVCFGANGRARLQAALERRLAELIGSGDPADLARLQSQAVLSLAVPAFDAGPGPAELGSGIAETLHRGLLGPKAGVR